MKTQRFLHFLAAAVLPLLALSSGRAAETPRPLERTLRLNLWGAGLKDVAVAVKEATGVDIVFYLPDLPAGQNTDNVYLVTGNVTLATALETLARRFGFRFRVAESGRVELSRGYGWVPEQASLRFARMDCLASRSGDCAPEETRAFLDELLKPLPLLSGDFTVKVEAYPLPGKPSAQRAAVVLPDELGDYFVKSVDCLSGSAGDFPADASAERFFARAREYDADWEKLLSRPVQPPRGDNLRTLLADVAEQANVAIALRAPPPEKGALSADIFRYTLGRISETLAENWGLGKRVFLASGGVVFERGAESEPEMDSRSRELFWGGLAVAGFDVGAAVARAGGVDGLLSRIRREAFPGIWRDPVCAIVYSPATERVAVVAPYNAVEAVAAKIAAFR